MKALDRGLLEVVEVQVRLGLLVELHAIINLRNVKK
jgi:hypothetical protein